MTVIYIASLLLQSFAVYLAVRLNWLYRPHRCWWVLAVALSLVMFRQAASYYLYLTAPEDEVLKLVSDLVGLNVSVLMVSL
jgi:hypothetical protein